LDPQKAHPGDSGPRFPRTGVSQSPGLDPQETHQAIKARAFRGHASANRLESADRCRSGEGKCSSTGPRGSCDGFAVVRDVEDGPVRLARGYGRTGPPSLAATRPAPLARSGTWSGTLPGRGRSPSSDSGHRSAGGRGGRGVSAGGGGEPACDQVFVGRAPDGARGLLLPPAAGAGGAVAPLVRFVGGEHGPPAFGQPGKLRAGHRQQGRGVGTVRQFGQHVEALPYRIAQHLAEYLVHRIVTVTFPPVRRLLVARPATGRAGQW